MENKIFKFSINGGDYVFRVSAESLVLAAEKFKKIPDIGYYYNELEDSLTISCEGDIF